ncbi:hypothetical protein [Ammoniphilus resinae]|uniref:Uncharacterized protein n=1 Tax=Ammoniphilus resinae TaxID=861532 RepID=A0ABS4GNW1_9BACL|nr:hypothetical protein [Ammoniphilus resinae]MBP1931967.1 hypothetical protein [Ammoniphilus resinae]
MQDQPSEHNNNHELNLRDLDHAYLELDLQKIERERKFRSDVAAIMRQ